MTDDLTARGDDVFERLFGARPDTSGGTDPELMAILRRVIFGDVFSVGELDDRRRELVTVTVLASLQCLPQLTAHTGAALHVGATPVEIREAVYQLAPFIGFPRALNAMSAVNEAFAKAGIELPLEPQATTPVEERFAVGSRIQQRLYGDEIREEFADGSVVGDAVPRLLTEFCFGDFETRGGLDVAERELLVLVSLVALGHGPQVAAHVGGCREAGVSDDEILAAVVHCLPYVGFPETLGALREIRRRSKA